ncbi:MAG TPA: TetR/AcrR family transcriptional regulator [Methanocella sp.]|uniref:TetR/AcrR family transcriptional regulator n=1 Tax=Methanocella sp. TaxID=2052833 RepID=UPI002C9BEFE3|nr:TetR/AcrR family transcriptional regulator [Methanocella sp.]HTY90555.1 TetR/AcrR family transcriptional regulator [Methanocella sp.]
MRVAKDPVVRRNELIDTAEELFRENGCEETSVSDIVKKVGVAQGTFYYYFKSKDDILDAVLDHYLKDHLEPAVKGIMADGSLDTMQKIDRIIKESLSFQMGERKVMEFLHTDKNMASRQKYMLKVRDMFVPIITDVLEEGIASGMFTVPYPRETAELLLVMFTYMHESAERSANGDYGRKVKAAEDIVVKVLGLKEKGIELNI